MKYKNLIHQRIIFALCLTAFPLIGMETSQEMNTLEFKLQTETSKLNMERRKLDRIQQLLDDPYSGVPDYYTWRSEHPHGSIEDYVKVLRKNKTRSEHKIQDIQKGIDTIERKIETRKTRIPNFPKPSRI